MTLLKRRRNERVLTPCPTTDQSAAGESSDLHPREKRDPPTAEEERGEERRGGGKIG